MYNRFIRGVLGHPHTVIATWLVVASASAVIASAGLGSISETGYSVPGSASTRVAEILRAHVPADAGTTVYALITADHPPPQGAYAPADEPALRERRTSEVDHALAPLRRVRDVASAQSVLEAWPQRRPLLALVAIRLGLRTAAAEARLPTIERVLRRASGRYLAFGLLGGAVAARRYSLIAKQDLARAERLTLPATLAVLLVAFLSVVAAALPILLSAVALVVALAVIRLLSLHLGLSIFVIDTAPLVALGLSIDYSLLIVTRFREERAARNSVHEAMTQTMRTAGRAVILSGVTVAASMAALLAVGVRLFTSIALGGILASFIAVLLAVTLLPATIVLLDARLDRLSLSRATTAAQRGTLWRGLARAVTMHPVLAAVSSLVLLLLLAAPCLSLRLDFRTVADLPHNDPMTRELRRVTNAFGPGMTGLVEIVTRGSSDSADHIESLIAADPNVASILATERGSDGWHALDVVLRSPPESADAYVTVRRLRHNLAHSHGTTLVGGLTAAEADLTSRIASRTPLVAIIASLTAMLSLIVGLRSVVIPLKAILGSLLSVAATLGVLVLLFPSTGESSRIAFSVPLVIFVLVFGLSIDYEVFLVSRIREAAQSGHPVKQAVTQGVIHSARPITLAGLTAATVFAALIFSSLDTVRQLGVGMVVAIALDVGIVRCVLVPAGVVLLGRSNWWLPRPLGRKDQVPVRS